MNPLILIIISAILFISNIIGLIIGIIKLKQANKKIKSSKQDSETLKKVEFPKTQSIHLIFGMSIAILGTFWFLFFSIKYYNNTKKS
jgi:hypothetical protein